MLSHRDWLRIEMDWNRFSSALLQTFSVVRAVEERVDHKMLVAILCCIRCITDIQTLQNAYIVKTVFHLYHLVS